MTIKLITCIATGWIDKTSTWNVVVEAFAARWTRHGGHQVRVAVGLRQIRLRLLRGDAVLSAVRLALVAAVVFACVHVHVGPTAPQIGAGLTMIFVEVRGAAAVHVARASLDAVLAVLRQVCRAGTRQVLGTAAELDEVGAVADARATLAATTSGEVLLTAFLARCFPALAQDWRHHAREVPIGRIRQLGKWYFFN